MKLLVVTQKVDINDSVLGFFHRWLEEFAKYCESIIVVCLQKGEHRLPQNVRVLSLGKEDGRSRIKYLWNFYKYIFKYKNDYDGVFVHMNKEYVLLGGLLWKLWNKKILLWYVHKAVGWHLWVAEKLVDKIFTASKESFRLSNKKVEITGHGIEVSQFENPMSEIKQGELRLLTVGRISAVKDLKTIVKAVGALCQQLLEQGFSPDYKISWTIIGEPITSSDRVYQNELEQLKNKSGVSWFLNFMGGISHAQMPLQYWRHHILIHTSRTGSIDKVVLEAMASGRIIISSSEAFADLAKEGLIYTFPAGDHKALAKKIEEIYKSGALDRIPDQRAIDYVRENHNLDNLIKKIIHFYVA